ncbi:MAG: DNA/RNA nuclease SfsA [Anaerolineae bacterium]
MNWPLPLLPARFIRRENRFRAVVEIDGRLLPAHVPNSGRMKELFTPGAAVWVAWANASAARKTACHLALVEYAGVLVSVDARLPNRLAAEALAAGRLASLAGYSQLQPEVRVGASRLDILLSDESDSARPRCWLEIKSVTLVEEGCALFPDAPTTRGVKHLEELATLRRAGERVAVGFVVQRSDVRRFRPHPTADPAFAASLRRAYAQGVEVYAWRCAVSQSGIELTDPLSVDLDINSVGEAPGA